MEYDTEKYHVVSAYNIYNAYVKTGSESGYAKAFAKGLIYENAGLTPLYLYDSEEGTLYVTPQEYVQRIVTLH